MTGTMRCPLLVFLGQGLTDFSPWAKSDSLCIFVNTVLLEQNHSHSFMFVYGCLHAILAELIIWIRNPLVCKVYDTNLPFSKKVDWSLS